MSVIQVFIKKSDPFPEGFGLQLKEGQINGSYSTNVSWSWDSGNSRLEQHMATGGISFGMMFFSIPKASLDGNKVKVDWQAAYEWDWTAQITVMDGAYDRTSTDDFPQTAGTWFATKGVGELYNYSTGDQFSFARETRDTGVLDLSSSTQDDVTVFIRLGDYHNTYEGDLWIYGIDITDSSDTVLSSMQTGLTPTKTNTGNWDYGEYGSWDVFYT